jgi:hypothetical protein
MPFAALAVQASQRAPHLRQLLLRLNFNGYAEREAAACAKPGSDSSSTADTGDASKSSSETA